MNWTRVYSLSHSYQNTATEHCDWTLNTMELKDKMLASFMAFEEKIKDNEDLHEVRNQAIKNFENKGFPTKKEEAWKYTSLNAILKNDFSVFPKKDNAIEFKDVKKYFLH